MPRARVFLSGDVMTGRGIDQILAHPSDPKLYESYLEDARDYVELAEKANGPIARPVSFSYVWGDALDELRRFAPHARIVNLETSVTSNDEPWPFKGINYRMHPHNVECLTAAEIDVCVLANNHVLDWGVEGLVETLDTLHGAGLATAGAGRDAAEAEALAVVAGGRVLVAAAAAPSSGVPYSWQAAANEPGVALLRNLDDEEANAICARLDRIRRPGDVTVVSLHWGSNWGYEVPDEHVRFAHALVDGGVDLVHGHSSHHPRPVELHRGRPIFYGCGDLLSDYEGIGGHEDFRGEQVLLYFATFDDGALAELRMAPMRVRKMQLVRASRAESAWLADMLARVSLPYGTRISMSGEGHLLAKATALGA